MEALTDLIKKGLKALNLDEEALKRSGAHMGYEIQVVNDELFIDEYAVSVWGTQHKWLNVWKVTRTADNQTDLRFLVQYDLDDYNGVARYIVASIARNRLDAVLPPPNDPI